MPAFRAVDFVGLVGRIHGDDAGSTQITNTLIERSLIALNESPLETTFRAPRRCRDFDLLIKPNIIGLDDEGRLTVLALAGFAIHTILCDA